MAGDPLALDESFIAVLVLLLVVLLSAGYVLIQQAPGAAAANAAGGGRGGAHRPSALRQTIAAPDAIPTAGLSDALLRLHRSLPSRHGARTATVCADALLVHKESAELAWASPDTATALADLLQLADVYVLCVVRDTSDQAAIDRLRAFLAALNGAAAQLRGLAPHRVLFCTTSVGKVAFVRQLEPQLHIEGASCVLLYMYECVWLLGGTDRAVRVPVEAVDQKVVRDLEKHVPRIVHVTSAPHESAAAGSGNHHVADTFDGYFKLLSAIGSP